MNTKKQKLELTWIGKGEEMHLEPRILIEDLEKSYGDKSAENMLIHGDNLLALKALEQDFAGKIKCIYIDPPFNTGAAFEHYDDGIEHSIWLNLMYERLLLLKKLLRKEGGIFVHIDYNEEPYLRVIMDEIFGRSNFRNTYIVSRVKKTIREREKVKALNFAHDVIIFYAASEETLILPPVRENEKPERWHGMDAPGFRNGMDYDLFGNKPAPSRHWAWTKENSYQAIENYKVWEKDFSNESLTDYWERTGKSLRFIKKNEKTGKPEYFLPASQYEILDTNWMDIQASAFNWRFPNGEKNESLILRVIGMLTNEGDWVLDSFLGSGTTAAVAHKSKRKWIGIELGDHADTHCLPRLRDIIDGKDKGGISTTVDWSGGSGFKFYNLAPSLLRKDSFGNFVIDEVYNANMLAAAMCKHEGFKFHPDEALYWKQGKSTEKDFIFVTTGFVTAEQLDRIHSEMKEGESLLICAKSFASESDNRFANITIKKIPQMILGKCEFCKDNYDLNIIRATEAAAEEDNEEDYE